MAVILHMRPQDTSMSWQHFCADKPPYSIALDGYVHAAPRFAKKGPYLNLNHHEEVDRLATRATCGQVLMALRQGLAECFHDQNGFRAEVFVNDCDEDVCLSWFLLKHSYLCEQTINPILNRLVNMEDMLDASAGAYPYPANLPILGELAWIFQPYRRFRQSGKLEERNPDDFLAVVVDVENRILRHLSGNGESIPLDTRYKRIGGDSWALVEEIGSNARTGMFSDGIRAFISARQRSDGNWTYSIGRMSPFVPFDVPRLLKILNREEGLLDQADQWGGGNTIGGSPRVAGSKLPPVEIEKIVSQNIH